MNGHSYFDKGDTVTSTSDVYRRLAEHLDRLPAGFPATPTGVEYRILERLFTEQEAELAVKLSRKPEPPEQIAARFGLDSEETAERLEAMAQNGLIFRLRKGPKALYMAAQFLVGIWEYHVNDLDPQLINDMNEYIPFFFEQANQLGTPQLRTIPISKALPPEQAVMPYEEARSIIQEQDKIIVAPCICRKEHKMMGEGCDRISESCLVFGAGAQYYEENGLGRAIDQADALAILEKAEAEGLVLQPSNSQKVVNICTCCGCCCQILKNLKKLPKPAEYVASNYVARVDQNLCSACGACVERCQMEAVQLDDTASIQTERCIGCGLCVTTCPEEAIALESKPEELRKTPPAHLMETYARIAAERMEKLKIASRDEP